jgi:hypothetical protein
MSESVLVDRPGRGYASDYTPWLVDGQIGEMVQAEAKNVTEQGIIGIMR